MDVMSYRRLSIHGESTSLQYRHTHLVGKCPRVKCTFPWMNPLIHGDENQLQLDLRHYLLCFHTRYCWYRYQPSHHVCRQSISRRFDELRLATPQLLLASAFASTLATAGTASINVNQVITYAGNPPPSGVSSLPLCFFFLLFTITNPVTSLSPHVHGRNIWTVRCVVLISSSMTSNGALGLNTMFSGLSNCNERKVFLMVLSRAAQ